MKKFLVAILALLYMSTSTGAIVNLHYCMGQLAHAGPGHHKSKARDKCGMEKTEEKKNDCCKDENKFLKSCIDQETTMSDFHLARVIAVAIPVSFFELPSVDIPSILEENPISHAPPQGSGVAVYIRNCVFLI